MIPKARSLIGVLAALAACSPSESTNESSATRYAPDQRAISARLQTPDVTRLVELPADARPLGVTRLDRADRLAVRFCLPAAGALGTAGERVRTHLLSRGWGEIAISEIPERPQWRTVHGRLDDLRLAGSLGRARQRGCDGTEDVAVTLTVVAIR
jgi:hypothetical protein